MISAKEMYSVSDWCFINGSLANRCFELLFVWMEQVKTCEEEAGGGGEAGQWKQAGFHPCLTAHPRWVTSIEIFCWAFYCAVVPDLLVSWLLQVCLIPMLSSCKKKEDIRTNRGSFFATLHNWIEAVISTMDPKTLFAMWLLQRPCLIKEIDINSMAESLYTGTCPCAGVVSVGGAEPTSFFLVVKSILPYITPVHWGKDVTGNTVCLTNGSGTKIWMTFD